MQFLLPVQKRVPFARLLYHSREERMEIVVFVCIVLLFVLAACRWGVDSREQLHSPEWERRRQATQCQLSDK